MPACSVDCTLYTERPFIGTVTVDKLHSVLVGRRLWDLNGHAVHDKSWIETSRIHQAISDSKCLSFILSGWPHMSDLACAFLIYQGITDLIAESGLNCSRSYLHCCVHPLHDPRALYRATSEWVIDYSYWKGWSCIWINTAFILQPPSIHCQSFVRPPALTSFEVSISRTRPYSNAFREVETCRARRHYASTVSQRGGSLIRFLRSLLEHIRLGTYLRIHEASSKRTCPKENY